MTSDKRLDQIEPVLSEVIAQQNLHSAQLRRANTGIVTIIETITQQSDDITFLLRGQTELRGQVSELQAGQAKLEVSISALNDKVDGFGQVLTAILNAVQKPSGN